MTGAAAPGSNDWEEVMVVRMPWTSGRSALAVSLVALPLMLVASCTQPKAPPPIANIPAPLPENIPLVEAPPPPPILINQSKGEDLWHLRSGLNVAVLLCQGADNAAMVAAYNRTLNVHKGLLASAAQTEVDLYRATGGKKWQDAYDDHMTKVYNAYSGTLTRDAFCPRAKTILDETSAATPERFSEQATVMLWELNKAAGLPDPDGKLRAAAAAVANPVTASAASTGRP